MNWHPLVAKPRSLQVSELFPSESVQCNQDSKERVIKRLQHAQIVRYMAGPTAPHVEPCCTDGTLFLITVCIHSIALAMASPVMPAYLRRHIHCNGLIFFSGEPDGLPEAASSVTFSDYNCQAGPHMYWPEASFLCSQFGKEFNNFIERSETQALLHALNSTPFEDGGMPDGPPGNGHIFVMGNSGRGRSAWICPRLLLPLAQWLSKPFAVRLNHVMMEFLQGRLSEGNADAARASLMQVRSLRPNLIQSISS